jgi:hypothetical protein
LAEVFQLYASENEPVQEEAFILLERPPYQLEPPINCFKRAEVQVVMNSLNPKKVLGYDITGKILKELPIIGISYSMLFCSNGTSRHNEKSHRLSTS